MKRFEAFRACYNEERPHEALGQVPPGQVYQISKRQYEGRLRSPDYDGDVQVRRVRRTGEIKWRGRLVYITQALAGEPVGLTQIDERTWLVEYGPVPLGTIKGEAGFIKLRGHLGAQAASSGSPRGSAVFPSNPPSPSMSGQKGDGGSEGKTMSTP